MGDPYHQYYYRQATGGALPVFRGIPVQRGYGLGNLMSAGLRSIIPGLKSAGIQKLLLSQGLGLATDFLRGKPLTQSLKQRALSTGKTVGKRVLAQIGLIPPTDDGPPRKRGRKTSTGVKKKGVARRKVQKGRGRRRARRVTKRRRRVVRRRAGVRKTRRRRGAGARRRRVCCKRKRAGLIGGDIFS